MHMERRMWLEVMQEGEEHQNFSPHHLLLRD